MASFLLVILSFLKIIIIVAVVATVAGIIRTWQIQNDANQKVFLAGSVPDPKPEGLYSGTVPGKKVSWLGKKFNPTDSTGLNIFDDGNGIKGERYPFKTYIGKGLHDKNLDVLKIDYNLPGNPFWLKLILDEIVQVGPDQYLGKLNLRIIPGYSFGLMYFNLKK
jgi:hypothetical protein